MIMMLLSGCGWFRRNDEPPVDDPGNGNDTQPDDPDPMPNPDIEIPTLADLLNDPLAVGVFNTTPNTNRFPLDPEWLKVTTRRLPLLAGQKYLETFEGDYFDTRLYPIPLSSSVTVEITEEVTKSIDGNSVYMNSAGNYAGFRFSGMRFTGGASFTLTLDYKILKASNDFIVQFRSPTGGVEADKFTLCQ